LRVTVLGPLLARGERIHPETKETVRELAVELELLYEVGPSAVHIRDAGLAKPVEVFEDLFESEVEVVEVEEDLGGALCGDRLRPAPG